MLKNPTQSKLVSEVAALIHKEKIKDAALHVSEALQLGLRIDSDNPAVCYPPLQYLLHWCLDNGGLEEAAEMLWPASMFNPRPECTQQVWNLFDSSSFGLIMGAASMSKSYTMGVRLFLEWLRDPEWTSVKLIGPSEEHLQANLFSHMVALHQQSKIPMPGEVGDLFIGLDRRNRLSSISGVVIPIGKVKKAGRLQGTKRKPRVKEHPLFGELSRLFIFIDEIENVQQGLWSDIDNLMANVNEVDVAGLKIFGAFNPSNQHDEVGKRCEPPFGWPDFDLDKHYRWTSVRGWEVLRLDGEKSDNVLAGKMLFNGIQTRAGLERISKNAGGRQSPGYMTMGRGAYPPIGLEMKVIPAGLLNRWRGEPIWLDRPAAVGSCDLALEGGATAVFTLGKFGRATGVKLPPSIDHPNGQTVMFKNNMQQVNPKWLAFAEQQFALPKGDTVKMKDALIDVCRKAGIKPEFLALDRTGHGAGTADLMKHEYGAGIHDVNYSQGASDSKIMQEDQLTCAEQFDRVATELWFALKAWAEFGFFWVHPQINMEKLAQQLAERRFLTSGKKSKVESKRDYMGRGFVSPDEADSFTLFVHAVRKGANLIPSMDGEGTAGFGKDEFDDDWTPGNGFRIDPSNATDFLDESAHPSL